MNTTTTTSPRSRQQSKPAADKAWKCVVYFVQHTPSSKKGGGFTMTDDAEKSTTRWKNLCMGKQRLKNGTDWAGKVNWAGIYYHGDLVTIYNKETNAWEQPK